MRQNRGRSADVRWIGVLTPRVKDLIVQSLLSHFGHEQERDRFGNEKRYGKTIVDRLR